MIVKLCNRTVSTAEIQSNERNKDDHKCWVENDLDEASHDLLKSIIMAFTCRD
jgi:hypothetical protein